ncbi:hypothetical protein ACLWBD_14045 [Bdellovibrio sp. HCB117]|uniref:hypothetical protein n=1 Tax=Bdellovibrio sp. HCB117 TaxID=3394359 RepID=UPI0039B587DA
MNFKFILGAFLCLSGIATPKAHAYFIASEPATIRAGVPTDVFVAGFGADQGNQFLKTAILAAKVSRDRFPERQRVIISPVNEYFEAERSMLSSAGFGFRKADKDELVKSRLILAMKYLNAPISSLQFFGHANTYNGFRLQDKRDRINHEDEEFAQIGSLLAPNAIVVFNSCNSGWLLAPTGAKLWRRPVFGSMTSSDFHEPMSDGQWYEHNPGSFPENLSRIGQTTSVIRESLDCGTRKCLRLRPVNTAYYDDFGRFSKGLGFYKVFSPVESLIPQALIHYTLLSPTVTPLSKQSSRQEMINAVVDWMCPVDKSSKKRNACREAIETKAYESNRTVNFFSGTPVACGNTTCATIVKCNVLKAVVGAVPCKTVDLDDTKSTVFSDQMRQIMKGLDLFEAGQLKL